jgi:hypothetical protein
VQCDRVLAANSNSEQEILDIGDGVNIVRSALASANLNVKDVPHSNVASVLFLFDYDGTMNYFRRREASSRCVVIREETSIPYSHIALCKRKDRRPSATLLLTSYATLLLHV